MVVTMSAVSCAIVGDGMVGKTCLAKKFSGLEVTENYVATIMDIFSGTASAYGEQYRINIKDTAGQFEDANIREVVYKQSDACVVCYSVVDRESMESVKSFWVPEIRKFSKKIPIILVATQADIRIEDCDDHINLNEGEQLAKDLNVDNFVETSSFKNDGVKQTFENVVKSIIVNKKCSKAKWLKSVFRS